jgi:hypothetical protein
MTKVWKWKHSNHWLRSRPYWVAGLDIIPDRIVPDVRKYAQNSAAMSMNLNRYRDGLRKTRISRPTIAIDLARSVRMSTTSWSMMVSLHEMIGKLHVAMELRIGRTGGVDHVASSSIVPSLIEQIDVIESTSQIVFFEEMDLQSIHGLSLLFLEVGYVLLVRTPW